MGSPWDARAGDALIVENNEPREALALLATLVDSTNFVVLYSESDDHHDMTSGRNKYRELKATPNSLKVTSSKSRL